MPGWLVQQGFNYVIASEKQKNQLPVSWEIVSLSHFIAIFLRFSMLGKLLSVKSAFKTRSFKFSKMRKLEQKVILKSMEQF